jgi:hypothetical protein
MTFSRKANNKMAGIRIVEAGRVRDAVKKPSEKDFLFKYNVKHEKTIET